MFRTNYLTAKLNLRLAVSVAFVGLLVLLPGTVWAGGFTVKVPPPNGVDDTANIQAALDACVASGKTCTVQLAAGNYRTSQLVEYNFRGTFKGMGMNSTTIEALPNLTVSLPDAAVYGECLPNTTTCLWPSLIIFVDGNIHVSDLSIRVTAPPGTATSGWTIFGLGISSLLDGLRFMGQHPTDVTIDRISIEGLPDNSPNSFGMVVGFGVGFNVVNEIIYTGELPRSSTPFDYYFMTGSLTVRNSSFKMAIDGVSQDGFLQSSQIVVGGSPATGNHFENLYVGMDMEGSESSTFDISYNISSGIYAGMWVIPWQPVFVPTSGSRYLIHDNQFSATGQHGEGIFLDDNATNPWIHAAAWNNTVELQDTLSEGIGVYNTKGTAVWNNSVTGSDGTDGIGLWSTTLDAVANNNVSGFTVDNTAGLAQIYLDPSTTSDLVVCAERSDTVLNQGTNNAIIGCEHSTASTASAEDSRSAARAASASRRSLPRQKSLMPH
ncbi:MAG: hypothetical protein ACLPLR_14500 [Terriglobales bacterium]